ncbi:MAG: acetyltransferase, partial [Lentisphaeria bacterium]|nr:acetyltransferase [Lentisphaeria bacterium]
RPLKTMTDTKQLLIYGNGAMARVVYSYVRRRLDVCAFTVDKACIETPGATFCGLPLVPFGAIEESFDPEHCDMVVAVGFLDMNELRQRKADEARAKGYHLIRYIHDSVVLHDDVAFGEHCMVLDHTSIHPGTVIGPDSFICSNVSIGHHCAIGAGNWINSGVSIAGRCQTGPGCFFGVNACVADSVRIGARNFVAANTLVNRDTADDAVYLSEPGRRFRLRSKAFLKFSQVPR